MYEPRIYRSRMVNDRFVTFRVIIRESDLMIGVSKDDYYDEIPVMIEKWLLKLRRTLEHYISKNPEFTKKMIPIPVYQDDPEIVKRMKDAAEITNTGPMASVAGMISQEIGDYIIKKNNPKEIYIENG